MTWQLVWLTGWWALPSHSPQRQCNENYKHIIKLYKLIHIHTTSLPERRRPVWLWYFRCYFRFCLADELVETSPEQPQLLHRFLLSHLVWSSSWQTVVLTSWFSGPLGLLGSSLWRRLYASQKRKGWHGRCPDDPWKRCRKFWNKLQSPQVIFFSNRNIQLPLVMFHTPYSLKNISVEQWTPTWCTLPHPSLPSFPHGILYERRNRNAVGSLRPSLFQ